MRTSTLKKTDYQTSIKREINKSRKLRDSARLFYYLEARNKSAVASYEVFKKSWAFEGWVKEHGERIRFICADQNSRFGHLGLWT